MALIIAGDRSGAGKTTVTLAILASLCRRGSSHSRWTTPTVQSFKVGPDYIDPMFHQYVTGRACRNLDIILTSETYVQQCFVQHSQAADYAVIEGVMGLFDGAGGSDYASTAHIARLLNVPVLLVIDCSALSGSIAAIAHGYRSFAPGVNIAGVVLNRVGSDRHLAFLKTALEPLQLPVLGVLRRQEVIALPSRHLGLVPAAELPQLDPIIKRLAHLGDTCFDWSRIMPLLKPRCTSEVAAPGIVAQERAGAQPKIRIAVARDRAFSFYYQDNLDCLANLGADLIFWSPLEDVGLPENTQGLYFGGGFPEIFAQALAANQPIRKAVWRAIRQGMPTYAECGGLMYLCEQLVDFEGRAWPMVGILPATTVMNQQLTLGYRRATALQDGPLLQKAEVVWGHEFHRSRLSNPPSHPLFELQVYHSRHSASLEGWQRDQVHASYVHLHWGNSPELPQRFLGYCTCFWPEFL